MPKQHNYTRTEEEVVQLQKALRNPDSRIARRAQIVYQLHLGYSPQEVAYLQNLSVATVYNNFNRFAKEGITNLGDQAREGRPRKANATYVALLEATLETDPQSLGYAFTVWTLSRLGTYLHEQTGIDLSVRTLQRVLIQLNYRYGRPKRDLGHQHDPALREQVQEALIEVKKTPPNLRLSYSLWMKQPSD